MNEKIKELAIQSGLLFKLGATVGIDEHGTHTINEINVYDRFDHEKFAELILKECLKMCLTQWGNADYNTGRMHCYGNIQEHFGVKE